MADLDKTARYALKLASAEVLPWVVPMLSTDLASHRWADTETIAFPGEPARRCDTVAELISKGGNCAPWLLVLEVEARVRARILLRVMEYECRLLRKLRHGPHAKDLYQVAGIVIFLTGKRKDLSLSMTLPGTDLGLHIKVGSICLVEIQAEEFLGRIERGELGRALLPWATLMAGANQPKLVQLWLRLALDEPDLQRRLDYAGLALVFADHAGCDTVWKKELEGFEMWQSKYIREWKNEGRTEEKRTDLVKVLQMRFAGNVPADLLESIQQAVRLPFDLTLHRTVLHGLRINA